MERKGGCFGESGEYAYLKNLLNVSCRKMYDDKFVHLAPNEINLDLGNGMPVKITGSAFDGVIGTFVKVDKSRKERAVVFVQGMAAVMVAELQADIFKF